MSQHYLPPGSVKDGRFLLRGDSAGHISRVLRRRPGDIIKVFDGNGGRFSAELEEVSRSAVAGRILSPLPWSPPSFRAVICHALAARQALEETLRSATEAGASAFRPFFSARTQAVRAEEEWERRLPRYREIILSAAEQCELGALPELFPPAQLSELLEAPGPKFLGAAGGGGLPLTALAGRLERGTEVSVFIGPEGGFSEEELSLARRRGTEFFTLGPNVLRAENAAAAAAAILSCAGETLK
jgi:16S rRNA (uracil1498-N3)-methyltransferase